MRAVAIAGGMLQYERPVWEPLLAVVGSELARWFMWMCEVELADGVRLHAYKHVSTRCYLHLTLDGGAYAYTADRRYIRVHSGDAIDIAFRTWESLTPAPQPDEVTTLCAKVTRALG